MGRITFQAGQLSLPAQAQPSANITFTNPARYTEHQYLGNGDYLINSKNTFSSVILRERPAARVLLCGLNGGAPGICYPGSAGTSNISNHYAVLKLTTILTSNLVKSVSPSSETLPPRARRPRIQMHNLVYSPSKPRFPSSTSSPSLDCLPSAPPAVFPVFRPSPTGKQAMIFRGHTGSRRSGSEVRYSATIGNGDPGFYPWAR